MNDGLVLAALQRLESSLDDMLSGLCENLNRHIFGDQVFFDQTAEKNELRLGSCREANLNFFETDFTEHLEELDLGIQIHRNDKCLIAIAKIHTAPDRSFVDGILFYPVVAFFRRHIILFCVLSVIHHNAFPP